MLPLPLCLIRPDALPALSCEDRMQSTLMMALWRIVERESGSITIDGIDTLTIGLQDLRTCLALVPQASPDLTILTAVSPSSFCGRAYSGKT